MPPALSNDAAMQVLLKKLPNSEAAAETIRSGPNGPRTTMMPSQQILATDQKRGKSWVPPKPISGTGIPCKHFAEGFCMWGSRCNFIHNPMDQLKKMQGFIDF